MVIHFRHYCNTYGSLAAYVIALFFRLAGGEQMIGLPALMEYPYYDEETGVQRFPYRSFCMALSLFTLAAISKLTDWLFHSGTLHPKWDYFRCVVNIPEDRLKVLYLYMRI